MPERGDPASGLYRLLDRRGVVAEQRGGGVDVRDDVRDSPESGWALAGRLRRADDLDDHLTEPEEDTWSIAVTPFGWVAGAAVATPDLLVGTPSRSSSAQSAGRPPNDHPTMPVPAPTSRTRTPPIRQTASESTLNPARVQASLGSAILELVDGDGHGRRSRGIVDTAQGTSRRGRTGKPEPACLGHDVDSRIARRYTA
jgi:hypothetical protein